MRAFGCLPLTLHQPCAFTPATPSIWYTMAMRSLPINWPTSLHPTRDRRFALIACLLVFGVAIAGWWASPPIVLDVGSPQDGLYLRAGFYERENLAIGDSR